MAAEKAKIRMTVELEHQVQPTVLIAAVEEEKMNKQLPHQEAVFGEVVNCQPGAQDLIRRVEIIREA